MGSRAAALALALARQLLARLVVPAGSHAAGSHAAGPSPLSLSSAGNFSPDTVNLHRFVQVREPAVTVHAFLLRHVPAGMVRAGYDLAPEQANTVAGGWVAYRPRSVPAGLTEPELGTTTLPAAGGTLVRVDASVTWFPPRSAAEYLTAAGLRSVTVTAREVLPKRTVTRTFTSAAVIAGSWPWPTACPPHRSLTWPP